MHTTWSGFDKFSLTVQAPEPLDENNVDVFNFVITTTEAWTSANISMASTNYLRLIIYSDSTYFVFMLSTEYDEDDKCMYLKIDSTTISPVITMTFTLATLQQGYWHTMDPVQYSSDTDARLPFSTEDILVWDQNIVRCSEIYIQSRLVVQNMAWLAPVFLPENSRDLRYSLPEDFDQLGVEEQEDIYKVVNEPYADNDDINEEIDFSDLP